MLFLVWLEILVRKDQGYDVTGPSLVLVSKLNAHKFLIDGFFKRITPEFAPILKPLGFLYADWIIETFSSVFYLMVLSLRK